MQRGCHTNFLNEMMNLKQQILYLTSAFKVAKLFDTHIKSRKNNLIGDKNLRW